MDESENIHQDTENVNGQAEKKNAVDWKGIFSGSILRSPYVYKQRWFVLFLFVLSIVYMVNRYIAVKEVKMGKDLQERLVEQETEYITKLAEQMELNRGSQVLILLRQRNINLQEPTTPPKKVQE